MVTSCLLRMCMAAPAKPSADEALARLKAGNARFVAGAMEHPRLDAARLRQAGTENQADHAFATVLACSDSRVPVEAIFDAGIMDLFVIRVAGNVCNGDEIGCIEYGLCHVHTPLLVILGHTQCGAVTQVTRTLQGRGQALERNIPLLIRRIESAARAAAEAHPGIAGDALIPYATEANLWQAIEDLFMASPATRDLVKGGTAKIVAALYDVGTGQVHWLPEMKVTAILYGVESNPSRAMDATA